jgi:hypothetical protein
MDRRKAGKKFLSIPIAQLIIVYREVGGALIKLLMTAGSRAI